MTTRTPWRLLRNKDVVSALLIGAAAVGFLIASEGMTFGTPMDMGPSFFPRIVSVLLLCLAIGIGLKGLANLEAEEDPLVIPLRPIVTVFIAMALFVVTLRSLGLIAASMLLVLAAGAAPLDRRWREVAISAVVLSVFAGFLFVYGLGLQAPLLPWR